MSNAWEASHPALRAMWTRTLPNDCHKEAITLFDSVITLLGICPRKKHQRKFYMPKVSGSSLALTTWEEPKCLTEGKGGSSLVA